MSRTRQPQPLRPQPHGLYEPRFEHDACGIGFVAHIKGEKSRAIVQDALTVLQRLSHRGTCGSDPQTGDGAGILLQLSHRFFKRIGTEAGFDMPRRRKYGIGMLFLPPCPEQRRACESVMEDVVQQEGQRLIGWRDVPIRGSVPGPLAREVMPVIRQLYVARRRVVPTAFERKLYVIRKLTEKRIRERELDPQGYFHVASLSAETIVYKGLLLSDQLSRFYVDFDEPDFVSSIALVHSRYSTNTFPTWDLAQPFHRICHNGEINTVRGNVNWLNARKSLLQSAKFGGNLDRLHPIIVPGRSDSAQFDNMLELLHLGGRSLPHAMMMMIPEAWQRNQHMDTQRHAFYDYASSLMEPWDGPAAIAFTDGHLVGATLDRNGLRPARYLVTNDDRVFLASETGVADVCAADIVQKGRLRPGRMFIVDTVAGVILDDDGVKQEIVQRHPYQRWLDTNEIEIGDLPGADPQPPLYGDTLHDLQRAFGYTDEDLRIILQPMAAGGKEPSGSMGRDTPLAALSDKAPSLFNYFKQTFAQVTNPPIDPIRESLVMSVATFIGGGGNTFEETAELCHRIAINSPILSGHDLAKITAAKEGAFETTVLPLTYALDDSVDALSHAVERLCAAAVEAIDEGYNILVLSDRGVDRSRAAIPALLAVSAVHQHLIREGIRLQAGLIIETAEAREVHHFALLLGFGVAAVNPYLALDTIRDLVRGGQLSVPPEVAEANYRHAIDKGILKVMSKMGISCLTSYGGAQVFEALGINRSVIERHFTGTVSRIEGMGLRELHQEVLMRHARGYGASVALSDDVLPVGGVYQWRPRGERHRWNPATIAKLQAATRQNSPELYREFAELANFEHNATATIRGMLDFDVSPDGGVPLEEVEPTSSIIQRFCTGAMSYGSISHRAHETLAVAMNRIGGRSNSGEGGEESHRFHVLDNGDSKRSAIKQVASGRFGVHTEYLMNASELQIKVAQGAKPGEGGQLPGHKVNERIAKVRCSTPGVTLISPPPHHDIYSIEDLAQLIYDLKTVNPAARVSVKLVSEAGVGTIAAGVSKARADCVIIAGNNGGTGASPISSVQHAGLPWELGLAETQQVLVQNGLRGRIRVQVDGGLVTGRDVAIAALLGAEEFGFSTAPLIVMGCVMLRKCHANTCSVGIATQNPDLIDHFTGEVEHVIRFFGFVAEDLRRHMARLGFRTIDEMVGQVERLKPRGPIHHWKASQLDLSPVLAPPNAPLNAARRQVDLQDHELDERMDNRLIREYEASTAQGRPMDCVLSIDNRHRAVGAMLAGVVTQRHGSSGLTEDAIVVRFTGSAGQSFGAFLCKGISLHLEGDANDYVGKGLSGGRVFIRPPEQASFKAGENIIIGNVALYGATGGELYASGVAGERFAVRNSGARAVVEGVGDHACEYMTAGVVVVLGPTGRNFAAGMSGGRAFVFDPRCDFRHNHNPEMVDLEPVVEDSDVWLLLNLVRDHHKYTGSVIARRIIDNWDLMLPRFVKVMPRDYKRVLEERRLRQRQTGHLRGPSWPPRSA